MSEKKISLRNIIDKLIDHQQWVGFIVIIVAMIHAYATVMFEPKHIVLDIVYAAFFVLLIYGLVHAYKTESEEVKKIRFGTLDGPMVIIGVFATFSIVHFFGVSVVIASAFIGLTGHFLVKKYEVAIYCGSFAGMVSVAIFSFPEVFLLSLVCAVIFILTKPLFKGYGGKLGTIAFMSSLIVHSIFFDEFLSVDIDFHLGFLLATTIVGVASTYYLQHIGRVSSVFASALTSMIFAITFIYLFPDYSEYVVVFFSASFIGMSSKEHLPNIFYVILSGLILGFIYYVFIELFNGLGGKLGLMALISVIITSGISKAFELIYKKQSE